MHISRRGKPIRIRKTVHIFQGFRGYWKVTSKTLHRGTYFIFIPGFICRTKPICPAKELKPRLSFPSRIFYPTFSIFRKIMNGKL